MMRLSMFETYPWERSYIKHGKNLMKPKGVFSQKYVIEASFNSTFFDDTPAWLVLSLTRT